MEPTIFHWMYYWGLIGNFYINRRLVLVFRCNIIYKVLWSRRASRGKLFHNLRACRRPLQVGFTVLRFLYGILVADICRPARAYGGTTDASRHHWPAQWPTFSSNPSRRQKSSSSRSQRPCSRLQGRSGRSSSIRLTGSSLQRLGSWRRHREGCSWNSKYPLRHRRPNAWRPRAWCPAHRFCADKRKNHPQLVLVAWRH